MAIELLKEAERILAGLPVNHPDARHLRNIVYLTHEHIDSKQESPLWSREKLDQEWQKQAGKMTGLFARALGYSEKKYLSTLPKFTLQPEVFRGRFDRPLLVETRIPLPKLLEICGINKYFDSQVDDWKEKTPQAPYTTWLNDGSINLGKSVDAVRNNLKPDERGGTVYDGIALYLQDLGILNKHYLDLPGSKVGSHNAPYLHLWNGGPGLGYRWADDAHSSCGSVVCGKI